MEPGEGPSEMASGMESVGPSVGPGEMASERGDRMNQCPACHEQVKKECFHLHHILPRSLGGVDDISNLISICNLCHTKIHQGISLGRLIKQGLSRAAIKGVKLGAPIGSSRGRGHRKTYSPELVAEIIKLTEEGVSLRKTATLLRPKWGTLSYEKVRTIYLKVLKEREGESS